jgi:hypothetical protein
VGLAQVYGVGNKGGEAVSNITLPRAEAEQIRQALVSGKRLYAAIAALDAALAEPKKERAEVAAPARGVAGAEKSAAQQEGEAYREHVTDGSPCWCNPELNYRDPDTGTELWIHRREQ